MAVSNHPSKLKILLLALRELGPRQLGWYAVYRVGIASGFFRWREKQNAAGWEGIPLVPRTQVFAVPTPQELKDLLQADNERRLISGAEEVLAGRYRPFGAASRDFDLSPASPKLHWSRIPETNNSLPDQDIKLSWEAARFGWATVLARAYAVSCDERFSSFFWMRLLEFLDENPPYFGENWVSAQEAAIRLIAWTFCWQVFSNSPHSTEERLHRFARAIGEHAFRISLTTAYARAQNNNHLLSEAAGLYTAAVMLPGHPSAPKWRSMGWRLFHQALCSQISDQGVYIQHSANYTRLMLQLALWVHALGATQGDRFPEASCRRLAESTRWLADLLDRRSGQVPNLGPNDGAYILPLTELPNSDYRPVLQAASRAFLGKSVSEAGHWDEMGLWFGIQPGSQYVSGMRPGIRMSNGSKEQPNPIVLRSPDGESWAYLRATHFDDRPGHADQLHVDLWWRGLNLSLDPGTYFYNAPPPWNNRLAGSDVHNTVTVAGQDQMLRAGRFLYLGWAQARLVSLGHADDGRLVYAAAEHEGYRRLGAVHRRSLSSPGAGRWIVEDIIYPYREIYSGENRQSCCLTWLLPDGPWKAVEQGGSLGVRLEFPQGAVVLDLAASSETIETAVDTTFQIVRAGRLVYGAGEVKPHWGWFSPTYAQKIPALLVRFDISGCLPIKFRSEWKLS